MLRVKYKTVEISVALLLLALGALIFYESLRIGAGWTFSGPQAGFFPIMLTIMVIGGCAIVLITAFRRPNDETFFEVSQEIVDLLKVGVPILVSVVLLPWLGMILMAGIYLGVFMIYYGKYSWWQAAIGGGALGAILWLLLIQAFSLRMPTSVFYPTLPF